MEILKPAEESVEENKIYNEVFAGTHINPKSVEFLAYLGLKDEMLNPSVMEKVAFLTEKLELSDLENLSLKFGKDGNMSKLDKILVFVKLSDQESDYKRKLDLITESKENL